MNLCEDRRKGELQYLIERNKITDALLDSIFGPEHPPHHGEIEIFDSMMIGVLPVQVAPVKGFFSPTTEIVVSKEVVTIANATGKVQCDKHALGMALAQSGETIPALLPPSRNDVATGQAKLLVDVAIAIPEMSITDTVLVVGGYSQNRGGRAYALLAGHVASVDLYDPNFPYDYYRDIYANNNTTRFNYFKACWPPDKVVTHDIFFNDAYIKEDGVKKCVAIQSTSRVVSMKRFFGDPLIREDTFRYWQVRKTKMQEWREVFPRRIPRKYGGRFGNCVMCRELDYFTDYEWSSSFRRVWAGMHDSRDAKCSFALVGRPPDSNFMIPDIGCVTVKPVYKWIDAESIMLPFEIDKKDSGQRDNLIDAVGSIPPNSISTFARKYIDFTLREVTSSRIYSTRKVGNSCESYFIPTNICTPSYYVNGYIAIGMDVYELKIQAPPNSKMINSTELIEFAVPQPLNVSGLVLLRHGKFMKKFQHWKTLDKFIWFQTKGL